MAFLLGETITVAILYAFWQWAILKRVWGNTLKAKMTSVVAAWLTACTLAGFGTANGQPFYFAYAIYSAGALIVGILVYVWERYRKSKQA